MIRPSALLLFVLFFGCNPPISKLNVLVIGDESALGQGWVYDFQQLRKGGPLTNASVVGNTFGYDRDGKLETNALNNATASLRRGFAEMGGIDEIIVSLGANDCGPDYAAETTRPADKLEELIFRVRSFFFERGQALPRTVVVLPAAGEESCRRALATRLERFSEVRVCVVESPNAAAILADCFAR